MTNASSNTQQHRDAILGRDVVRLTTRAGMPHGDHGDTGIVVNATDDRIRIKWAERRTWLARKAEGSRWALADSEQGKAAAEWRAAKYRGIFERNGLRYIAGLDGLRMPEPDVVDRLVAAGLVEPHEAGVSVGMPSNYRPTGLGAERLAEIGPRG